jgi:transposase
MLDSEERRAVLTLKGRGLSNRAIAKAMRISRSTVEAVIDSGRAELPLRESVPQAVRQRPELELLVRELYKRCDGFVTRVAECLETEHEVTIPYSTLARYVERLGLHQQDSQAAAHREINTAPGEEMQHDTSPIAVVLGGKAVVLHLAELVFSYSRHRYMEFFGRWQRFHLKVFFTRALVAFGGACRGAVVDNAKVIVILGAGPDGTIAPEMERFGDRFGFKWHPIPLGKKDWNGKVEKAHQFVQTNFLPGRRFRDLADLNAQLFEWREKIFTRPVRGQEFAPCDRWPAERAHLTGLPPYIPAVSRTWSGKRVDDFGWIWLHRSRYSVPDRLASKHVTVRETADEVIVLDGSREICRHRRIPECERGTSRLPAHHPHRSRRPPAHGPSSEECHLRSMGERATRYLDDLAARPIRYSYARLRRLYRFSCDYPPEIFLTTLALALERRVFDLNVLEKLLEEKMGHRIFESRMASDADLEKRASYRQGQVTPHRLREMSGDVSPSGKEHHVPTGTARGTPHAAADVIVSCGTAGDLEGGPEPAQVLHDAPGGAARARARGA